MSDGGKYAAFISYKRDADSEIAAALVEALETYRIPKRIRAEHQLGGRIGRMFRDTDELAAAGSLSDALREALASSHHLIVVCSPEARSSRWIELEVEHFIELGREDRILAVLVRGEVPEVFPPALARIDPLAIDIRGATRRAWKRKLASEKLRLLAPLIGCDYDALRQRDAQRAMARLRWTAGGAAAFAAASVAVLLYVLGLRQLSESRRIASEARLAAADQVLDRLDKEIGDRIAAGADPRAIQADLVQLIVDTRKVLDDTGADNPDSELMTHFRRAELAVGHASFEEAVREYEAAIAVGDRHHAGDVSVRHDVAVSHHRLADIAKRVNDPDRARRELDIAIAQTEALVRDAPTDGGAAGNLCMQYAMLGELEEATDEARAIATYTKTRECVAGLPGIQVESQETIAHVHRNLARIHLKHDKVQDAIGELRSAIAASEPYIYDLPGRFSPVELGDDYFEIATLLERAGNLADATRELAKGGDFITKYRTSNPQSSVVLRAESLVRARILRNQAKLGNATAVKAAIESFVLADDLIQHRLEVSTGELARYVDDTLVLAMRLRAFGSSDAAVTIARRTLATLNRFVTESKTATAHLIFVNSQRGLSDLLGEPEVLAATRAAAETCRARPPADESALVACGYSSIALARAATRRDDVVEARKQVEELDAIAKRVGSGRSTELMRFRVAAATARSLTLAAGKAVEARTGSEAALQLARELVATTAPKDPPQERDANNDLLADALHLAALTAEPAAHERARSMLREAAALLVKTGHRLDALRAMGVYLAVVRLMIEHADDLTGARVQLRLIEQGLDRRIETDEFIDLELLQVALAARVAAVELAVVSKDASECAARARELEQFASRYVDASHREDVNRIRARCTSVK